MDLKFRVWSPTKKQMFQESVFISDGKPFIKNMETLEEIPDGRVMQSTGCKDMDHHDIYESDIVEYPLYNRDPFYARIIGVVRNKNGKWVVESPSTSKGNLPMVADLVGQDHVTIRGNLYQHPKLFR